MISEYIFYKVHQFFDQHIRDYDTLYFFIYGATGDMINRRLFNNNFRAGFVRPFLICFWRSQTPFFPVIYWLKCVTRISKWAIKAFSDNFKVFSSHKRLAGVPVMENINGSIIRSNLEPFPVEIWIWIMKIGGVSEELFSINKSFYYGLAPVAFKDLLSLQLLLVLSTTEKMRQNDACFLKYGPDFPHKPYKSYSIYERNLESWKYKYEFLDVDYENYQWYENEYRGTIITSFEKIAFLFDKILNNPNSMLKKLIKSVDVDISILHGYQEIMLEKDSKIDVELKKAGLWSFDNNRSMFQVEANRVFYAPDFHHIYDRDRWQKPNSILDCYAAFTFEWEEYEGSNDIFPNKVYGPELSHIGEIFKGYYLNNRQKMSKIKTAGKLRKDHPYNIFFEEYEFCDLNDPEGYASIAVESAAEADSVKILRRRFASESDTKARILSIIKTMSSEEICSGIGTSVFITGGSKPEKAKCLVDESQLPEGRRLLQYRPLMTIVNKPIF